MDDEEQSRLRKPTGKTPASKSATKAHPPVSIRPVPRKIGESHDNLEQRAEWFRRRTVADKKPG